MLIDTKIPIILFALFLFISGYIGQGNTAFAQSSNKTPTRGLAGGLPLDPNYVPKTSPDNICFTVENETDGAIYAQVITNYYQQPDGNWGTHRHNFRSIPGEKYPVCTTGPFFEDRKIKIQVKSLIPILTCYFDLEDGGKTLSFFKKITDDDVVRLWANCDVTYPRLK